MSMSKIKVGDTVRVIAGKDKGREGKVLSMDHEKNRVVVEGVNMITKHMKQNQQNTSGGIVTREGSIHASNVMVLVNGKPARIGFTVKDGKKVRVAKTAEGLKELD